MNNPKKFKNKILGIIFTKKEGECRMIKRSKIGLNRIIYPKLKLEDFFKFAKYLDLYKIELRNDLPGKEIIDGYAPEKIKVLLKKSSSFNFGYVILLRLILDLLIILYSPLFL